MPIIRIQRILPGLAVLGAVMLVVGACGGEEEPTATPRPTTPAPTATPAAQATVVASATQPPQATPSPAATPPSQATPSPAPTAPPVSPVPTLASPLTTAAGLDRVYQEDIKNAKYGGVARFPLPYRLQHLDRIAQLAIGLDMANGGFFDRLVRPDYFNPQQLTGDLAESWTVSTDGAVYTFKLRPGVKWHDGQLFTGQDVKATWDYMWFMYDKFGQGTRHGGFLQPLVKSYSLVDDSTFRVDLKAPSSTFLPVVSWAQMWVLPAHKIRPKLGAASFTPLFTGNENPPVGTGPFKYKNWSVDVVLEWERSTQYWRKDPFGKQLPYLDGFQAVTILDETLRIAAFRTGRVDLFHSFPKYPLGAIQETLRTLGNRVTSWSGSSTIMEALRFNMPQFPLAKERDFRWALTLLFDLEEFRERVYEGEGVMGQMLDPRIFPDWLLPDDEFKTAPLIKQPRTAGYEEARKLLAARGVRPQDVPEIVIAASQPVHAKIAELAAVQLTRAGIKAKTYVATTLPDSYQITPINAAVVVADPITFYTGSGPFEPKATATRPNYAWLDRDGGQAAAEKKVFSLINMMNNTLDIAVKKKANLDLQRVIYFEDTPMVVLGYPKVVVPAYNYVHGKYYSGTIFEGLTQIYTWLDK